MQLAFAQCGDTASAYLRRKRMAAAAAMLRSIKTQQSTVTTIAYACGFNSASHFTTEFHRAFGMVPTTFRHAECVPSHCLGERVDN